jgi:hypothetical protein
MRLAGTSLSRALAGLSLTIVAAAVCLFLVQGSAFAAGTLTLTSQEGVSLVSASEALTVRGPAGTLGSASAAAQIIVHLSGPADVAQVSESQPVLSSAGTVTHVLDPVADLTSDGSLNARIVVPFTILQAPGAYLAEVQLVVDGTVQAVGAVWLGKVAVPQNNIDVACIWPLTLGIHRNADGIFFDGVLEAAVAGGSGGTGGTDGIAGLTALGKKFPNWKFSVAVEPVVLSQLRDMSDGYSRLDDSGAVQQVGADAEPAKNAAAALSSLKDLFATETRDVLVTPYAGPSMGALANKGWRDGLEQVQLGKQVTQQILSLSGTLSGVYASDLDMTTDSLASYGQASIDHVVVSSSVAADLTETLPAGAVTARARDKNNQRVTLVFADEQAQTLMNSPSWEIDHFYAGLAAELASGPRDALVITPPPGSVVPPAEYLQAVGEVLQRFSWIKTLTIADLVRAHSPGTRPVLLDRASTASPGYIAQGMQASVAAAHQAVQDIADAAGSGRQLVENAQASLYAAESAWWSQPDTSPKVASVGLLYAERARILADAELAKITTSGFRSTGVTGRNGTVRLFVENAATYPAKIEIRLEPEGLTLPGGNSLQVEAKPGRTEIPIRVTKTKGAARLRVTLVAGTHTLGATSHSVRFVTLVTFLPWAVGAVVVIAAVVAMVFLLLRRRKRKRRTRA